MAGIVNMSKVEHNNARSEQGFSLVSVLLIAMCAALWLTAMTAALIPMYKRVSDTAKAEQLRNAAESSIDFVIDQLSTSLSSGNPTPYDPGVSGQQKTTIIALAVYSVPNVIVSVTVKDVSPPVPPKGAALASSIYDPISAAGPLANDWRVVEATAQMNNAGSNGPLSSTQRYRVVLKPQLWPANSQSAWNQPSTSSFNPMQQFGVFALSAMTLGPNTSTDGYTPSPLGPSTITGSSPLHPLTTYALGGDVGSYGNVTMSGTNSRPATVGGSINVPESNGATTVAAQTSNASANQANRYVTVNGIASNISGGSGGGTTNVFGASNTSAGYPSTQTSYVMQGQNTAQTQVVSAPPPTPTFKDAAPSSGPTSIPPYDLGDVNLSNTTITVTNSAPPPPYSIPASGNLQVQPGNYTVGSLTTANSGQIIVQSDVSSSQPVRFFVSDNSVSPNALDLTTQGIVNNSAFPSNLQIYYNGNRSVTINQSNTFSGLVYTPNANLSLGLSGGRRASQVNYYGSFVGSVVETTQVKLHYDSSMLPTGSNVYSAQLSGAYSNPKSIPTNQQPTTPFWYFKIASWQEWPATKALPVTQ
jgi:hypothetical protein